MPARRPCSTRRLTMSAAFWLLVAPTLGAEQDRTPVAADLSERHRDLFRYALAALPTHRSVSALRSTVARTLYAMDQAPRAGFFDLDVRTLTSTLRSPSAMFEVARLVGDWDCRRILIGAGGLSVSDYFSCTIRKGARCLELESPAAPEPLSGCLYVLDARHMTFSTGVLSAANILNLRLIEPHGDGVAVYDFLRKSP